LFVRSSFVGSEREEKEGRNDEGKKKVMTRGRRSKEKDWWGESHTYRHLSKSAVPRFRPTNETWLNHADKISPLG
jgi:hypothetical protein